MRCWEELWDGKGEGLSGMVLVFGVGVWGGRGLDWWEPLWAGARGWESAGRGLGEKMGFGKGAEPGDGAGGAGLWVWGGRGIWEWEL